jgi:hypothetical protein
MDRSIVLHFQRLDGTGERKDEETIMEVFSQMAPEILGEILDRVSRAYRTRRSVSIPADSGRLLDLIKWIEASELDEERGAFRAAYQASRREQHETSADTDPLFSALVLALGDQGVWRVSTAECLQTLTYKAFGDNRPAGKWPQTPAALSARFKRDAPKYRSLGVEVEQFRTSANRGWAITRVTPIDVMGTQVRNANVTLAGVHLSREVSIGDGVTPVTASMLKPRETSSGSSIVL